MQIKASFNRSIFETSKDGILVGLYNVVDDKCKTFKGQMLPSTPGVVYIFEGEWITHPKYGKQFAVESYAEDMSSADSIIKFLSSPLIKGVGPTTAKRIVEKFGDKTIEVLDENFDILKTEKIKGLSANKLEEFKKSYKEQREAKYIVLELAKYGISTSLALKCYQQFQNETMKIIKNTPYELAKVEGVSFPVADRVGWKISGYELNENRFRTCALYVLYSHESGAFMDVLGEYESGSNAMEINDFGKVMLRLLRIKDMTCDNVLNMTLDLIKSKFLKVFSSNGKKFVMPMGIYDMEVRTAEKIKEVADTKADYDKKVVDKVIEESKYKFCKEQKEAIEKAFANNISIIIGIPGSGKTTTINAIATAYKKLNRGSDMYFLAPSGRAAAHIKETLDNQISDCAKVSTIHSALGLTTESVSHTKAEEEIKIEDALVIVDEISMLDTRIAYELFTSIKGCKVVLCGDDEQLPSVGSGAVLRDLIASSVIPVTVLTKVYRQEEDSDIYNNLFKIRNGETDLSEGKDFIFTEEDDSQMVEDIMYNTYLEKIKEYGIENVMLLSPMKENAMGVKNLNIRIQEAIHPSNPNELTMRYAYEFREGDIVMQIKNDYDTMTMNGDLGTVTSIYFDNGEKTMNVKFPHTTKKYTKENVDELSLGYAYTIHKAQGSEAKCVILCVHKNHKRMLCRNLYYTGITRAKQEIHVIGEREALKQAITTVKKNQRVTTLENHLRRLFGEWVNCG